MFYWDPADGPSYSGHAYLCHHPSGSGVLYMKKSIIGFLLFIFLIVSLRSGKPPPPPPRHWNHAR